MAINTDNGTALPALTTGLMIQYPEPPPVIPTSGVSKINPTIPTVKITTMPQVIGLVPLFECADSECRYGLYGADSIPDDRDFPLPAFASTNETGSYKNDYNTWIINYPKGYNPATNGDFVLQHNVDGAWIDLAILDNNTYGILYSNNFCNKPFDFLVCNDFNYFGYKIEWRKVLIAFGEGTYRFKAGGFYTPNLNYCEASPPFCLSAFDCHKVDGTVKFEADYSGGRFGSVTMQGVEFSLCCNCVYNSSNSQTFPISIQDSIRFFGFFGNDVPEYQRDSIKYQTGIINKVRDEAIKNFTFRSDKLPLWLHKRFYSYGLMADHLYVSDYNINNADYNLKHFYIVADSNYPIKYNGWSRYMKVIDAKFKEGQQYVFRDRCCSNTIRNIGP